MSVPSPLSSQARDAVGNPVCPRCKVPIPPPLTVIVRATQMFHLECAEKNDAGRRPLTPPAFLSGMNERECSDCGEPTRDTDAVIRVGPDLLHVTCHFPTSWLDETLMRDESKGPGQL